MQTAQSAPSASTTLPDGLAAPRRHWAVATLMLVLTVASLDATMVNVALPAIAADLGIAPSLVVWVMMANSLVVVVTLLPFAAVAERIGFRRMFAIGLTVFMLAAMACTVASSFPTLLAARVVQGLGSSMLMCLFGGLVRNIYPMNKLGFGISLNSVMVGLMAVLGPTIGAFILQVLSWPWVFAFYVPLCFISYFGVRFLPDVPRGKHRFDWWACVLSMLVLGLSIIGLDALAGAPLRALACLAAAVGAGVVLVHRSRSQTAPLVPVDLLRITTVAYAVAASCSSFASAMAAFVALPFYFLNVLGYSYADTGILLGCWSMGVACMAPVAGRLADRHPVSLLCGIGSACMTLGLIWVLLLPQGAAFIWVGASLLLGGMGFGFFQTPNNRAMLLGAPRTRSGAAGGLQATTRVFGQSLGTAFTALAFHASTENGAVLALVVSVVCGLGALAINVARYFSPVPDVEL